MNEVIVLGATMWAHGIYLAISTVILWKTHAQGRKRESNI
ncbi:uncharacterized protein DEA37_0000303 [Paragonimus westermani]|uniref:Uncharacterized protein n=1 Tax=Paragonimus westermani TaxID=34504 RepID=A0A5J4NXQ8_9TREM|nr:uncharacterized protein DEA37_0000303 [Paragonimus westermani]